MRVVVAPDKFKGSLSAGAVAQAIAAGLQSVLDGVEVDLVPMADGGDGTVDAFLASGAERVVREVRGPLGTPVEAAFAMSGGTAIIEMAAASGLVLLGPEERDANRATSYGSGELLRAALEGGARRLVIGIGGSATNDGGAGMLEALGGRLFNKGGEAISAGGAALAQLAGIDISGLDRRLRDVEIDVACDVTNPLCGPTGASAVYGRQKGASAEDVQTLDRALAHFADLTAATVGADLRSVPGTGAAGGLGFALLAFLGARLRSGVDLVAEVLRLDERLAVAALCVTGEGSIDVQTLQGKTVAGVARLARQRGVPVIAFGGSVDALAESALATEGVVCIPIVDGPVTQEESMQRARVLIERAAARLGRTLRLSRSLL